MIMKIYRDAFRKNLNKYSSIAFQLLPPIEKPRILDIGCGTGVPTLKLAEICDGNIIGIDIDEASIKKLNEKIRKNNLTKRAKTLVCSLKEMPFEDESFDIIWSEGSISQIGFENGLKKWKTYIKRGGFLVVHDELGDYLKKLSAVEYRSYKAFGFFIITADIWWNEYYKHLDNLLKDVEVEEASEDIKNLKKEIGSFKKKPESFESAFFIMRKN